ncbi:MAG: DUF1573 domain-containing protein [Candidatus Omnitrophica bacterium]|nr:DUF1573 domain-containing protein [Candidatus Omnitrophota bacterium]
MRKNVFLLISIFILTTSAYALPSKDNKDEALSLKSNSLKYDFGVVGKDKVTKKVVKIINKLGRTIDIKSAESTCECVLIYIKPQRVGKNGVFQAEISFDSNGLDKNQYLEEVVYILTGSEKHELIKIVISFKVTDLAA